MAVTLRVFFTGALHLPSLLGFVLAPQLSHGAQAELRFVSWRSDTPWVWDQAIKDFEARNPGIKALREIGPHSSTEFHDLVTQKLRNRDPQMDVFFMDVIWPAEFAAAGWALPLDGFFPAAEQKKFLEAPILANRYRGRIYGAPVFIDAGLLYYRRDLLVKYGFSPPQTWPELVGQARRILAGENEPQLTGYSGQFKQYEGLICNMMEYILGNGGALPSFPGGRSVATLGGWQLGVSRFSRQPRLAWKFIEFMTSSAIQKRIALFAGRAPARTALYRDADVLKKNPQFRSQFEAFTRAVPRPPVPVYIPLSNIMQRYFSSAISLPDSDIDRLAGTAARDMDRVLELLRGNER